MTVLTMVRMMVGMLAVLMMTAVVDVVGDGGNDDDGYMRRSKRWLRWMWVGMCV